MKKHLLLPTLSLSMVVPVVSCVPLTIQNNNEEITSWSEALVKMKNNPEIVKEVEGKVVQQLFNINILPTSIESGINDTKVNLFDELCKAKIIVNKQDFSIPEITINNVYVITLKSFSITNINLMWVSAKFGDGYEQMLSINKEDVFNITLDTPIKFKSTSKFWEGVN